MENWRNFMVSIMKELGKESNLTNDIYPLVEKRGTNLRPNWKARVRATLEENSSDTDAWNQKYDLFSNKAKGEGNWKLRELDESSLEGRLNLWKKIKKIPDGEIEPSYIRELKIYKGATGICRDDSGICISVLNTGKHYPDDIFNEGILYQYPNTPKRSKTFDINEINSVKECASLGLPLFIILPGKNASKRSIKLGWVEDFDDESEQFLIKFGQTKPEKVKEISEQDPFIGKTKRKKKLKEVSIRSNNQTKFRFDVIKRYGLKCALCNIENNNLLDAAHIIPVDSNGSDDPRNGLILCKNHHAAFDKSLFKINPNDFSINLEDTRINISEDILKTKTGKMPHKEALEFRFGK
tara:strand:- start:89 stop:1147 length:1059 start_codon:yes stop_codon:yes gene_type:complete